MQAKIEMHAKALEESWGTLELTEFQVDHKQTDSRICRAVFAAKKIDTNVLRF